MHRFEERAPVESWLRLHQLTIEVLQKRARAEGEGILERRLDQVIAVGQGRKVDALVGRRRLLRTRSKTSRTANT